MELIINAETVKLPDFMIVGAAKSGTTSLYRILSEHPEIYFPHSQKEPFYFCFGGKRPELLDEETINRVTWDSNSYFKLFDVVQENQIAGDASTAYLYKHAEVIQNMESHYGDKMSEVKILMILRNPVDRAYSHYTYLVRNGFEDLSFEEAIQPEAIAKRKDGRWGFDYLNYGSYPAQVQHFKKRFPNCKIFLMEDLKEKQRLIDQITSFLEVGEMEIGKDVIANPSGVPKSKFLVNQLRKNKVMKWSVNQLPERVKHKILNHRDAVMGKLLIKKPLNPDTRNKLIEHYRSDILKLESLLGRSLQHWLN